MSKHRNRGVDAEVAEMPLWEQATLAAKWLVWQQENGNLSEVREGLNALGSPLGLVVLLEMSVLMSVELRAHLCESLIFGVDIGPQPKRLHRAKLLELAFLQFKEDASWAR